METSAEACIRLMDENITFHAPCVPAPVPRSMSGIEAVAGAYRMLFALVFKSFCWSGEVLATEDPEVAIALMNSRVEVMDGRVYSNDYAVVSRVRNGKICEHTEFFDTTRASEAFAGLIG